MIKRINKIKNLGVFSNYTRNSELKDFDEKNIKPNMNLVETNKYKEVSDDEFFDDFFD